MKLILVNATNEVSAIVDDAFTLAPTDTDISIMSWDGDAPEIGSIYSDGAFITKWQAASDVHKLNTIRKRRDRYLVNSDFAAIRHRDQLSMAIPTTITEAQYNILMSYRQALRDITTTCNLTADTIDNIGWPTTPDFV